MQKLNAREIYVLVIIALLTVVLSIMLTLELVSEYSSLRTVDDGSISINRMDLISNINTFFQVILGISAFVLFLRKRRTGWIISLALLLLVSTVIAIALLTFLTAGFFETAHMIGVGIWLLFFMAVIFLVLPGTRRKFNVGPKALIPVFLLLAIMVSVYFIVR